MKNDGEEWVRVKRAVKRRGYALVDAKPLTEQEQRVADLHAAMRLLFALMVEDVQAAYQRGSVWTAAFVADDYSEIMWKTLTWGEFDDDTTWPYEVAIGDWAAWSQRWKDEQWQTEP